MQDLHSGLPILGDLGNLCAASLLSSLRLPNEYCALVKDLRSVRGEDEDSVGLTHPWYCCRDVYVSIRSLASQVGKLDARLEGSSQSWTILASLLHNPWMEGSRSCRLHRFRGSGFPLGQLGTMPRWTPQIPWVARARLRLDTCACLTR